MKKLFKTVFISLSVLNLIFSAVAAILGIALKGDPLEPIAVALTVAAIISTGIFLTVSFIFLAEKPTLIAFIASALSAVTLIVSGVILFS